MIRLNNIYLAQLDTLSRYPNIKYIINKTDYKWIAYIDYIGSRKRLPISKKMKDYFKSKWDSEHDLEFKVFII